MDNLHGKEDRFHQHSLQHCGDPSCSQAWQRHWRLKRQGEGKEIYVCPPPRGAETGGFAVVGIELAFFADRRHQRRLEVMVGEACDAALSGDGGVLLDYGASGAEECAKGVEAEQEVSPGHEHGSGVVR